MEMRQREVSAASTQEGGIPRRTPSWRLTRLPVLRLTVRGRLRTESVAFRALRPRALTSLGLWHIVDTAAEQSTFPMRTAAG